MVAITVLRKHIDKQGEVWDEAYEEVTVVLDRYGEQVDETYEDGGRWTNYRTTVYRVSESEEVAYFSLWRELPATESQDGGDFSYELSEVVPQEVTVTRYVAKKGGGLN